MHPSSGSSIPGLLRRRGALMAATCGALLALAGTPVKAQLIGFDAASGIVTIPSVQVGADVYTNVRLLHLGNYRFALQSADLQTPPGRSIARYDGASGLLNLPAVKVGTDTFVDVSLLNVGSFNFTLQGATLLPAETIAAVNGLMRQNERLWAAAAPSSGAARMSLTDACYRNDGRTRAYLVSEADNDLNAFRSQYSYRIGEKISNLQVLGQRTVSTAGATRQELDVQYDITFADGSFLAANIGTVVSGNTIGTPGCSTGQSTSDWRFFGNQQLVQATARSRNIRDERYLISNGGVASPAVNLTRDVQWVVTDPMANATYVVVSGPGPAATVGGVATSFSLKMISPRLLRSAPELANANGNFLNWMDDDGFRYCRIAGSGVALAALADCVGQGARDNTMGITTSTPNATADASFDNLGFVAGGLYTFAVYNDDGWKTVNGHVGRTPIAVYTDVLDDLSNRFVEMSPPGAASDNFPHLGFGGMSMAQVRSNLQSATPAPMAVSWTPIPAVNPYRVFEVWEFFQGPKLGSTTGGLFPGYRVLNDTYPGSNVTSVPALPVSPKLSTMSSKTYAEFLLLYSDRKARQIQSKVSFN